MEEALVERLPPIIDIGPERQLFLDDTLIDSMERVLSPQELIEKLAALVPPPRLNLVRYHGVLAPHAGTTCLAHARRHDMPDTCCSRPARSAIEGHLEVPVAT